MNQARFSKSLTFGTIFFVFFTLEGYGDLEIEYEYDNVILSLGKQFKMHQNATRNVSKHLDIFTWCAWCHQEYVLPSDASGAAVGGHGLPIPNAGTIVCVTCNVYNV